MGKLKFALLLFLLFLPGISFATIYNAADYGDGTCSNTNVQSAVDAAADGDTVTIPAGSCTWTGAVATGNKGIIFVGAGVGVTNINASIGTAFGSNTFFLNATGKTFEISHMTLTDEGTTGGTGTGSLPATGHIWVRGNSNIFKIHDNSFSEASYRSVSIQGYGTYGVIYGNTFIKTVKKTTETPQFIWVSGGLDTTNMYLNWSDALSFGSANAVYVEYNTFTANIPSDGILDYKEGAKVVFRYNTINQTALAPISNHGADSGYRSGLLAEIYNNEINVTGTILWGIQLRGGTGIIRNNAFSGTGSFTYPIFFTNYRSCTGGHDGGHPIFPSMCDGDSKLRCSHDLTVTYVNPGDCDAYGDGSYEELDQNTAELLGYACRDQIGRGSGQASSPFYIWDNTGTSTLTVETTGCTGSPTPADHIQENRDYFLSAKAGYTPYTCPHPLAYGGSCDSGTAGTAGYHLGVKSSATYNALGLTAIYNANGMIGQ